MGELTSEAARGTQHSCTATPTPVAATEGARHGGERTWMTASGLSPLRLAPIKLSSSSRCASMVTRPLQTLEVDQPADEHECTRTRRHALCVTRTSLRTTNEHAQNTAHKAPVMLCEVGNGALGLRNWRAVIRSSSCCRSPTQGTPWPETWSASSAESFECGSHTAPSCSRTQTGRGRRQPGAEAQGCCLLRVSPCGTASHTQTPRA